MRAVLFYGPKNIRLVRVPIPQPGPGEVLIKVGAALTCGTDFKAYRQGHRVLLGELPAPFGHELAGTVVLAGAGAPFKPGARVAAANSAPCDKCFFCLRGQPQLCDRLKLHNGAYAEYNLLPAQIVKHNLYPIPESLDFADAALCEPLACAIHAVDALRVDRSENAVVIGAGVMSQLLTQALKARGAEVTVIGRDPGRLKAALAAGADRAVSALEDDPIEAVRSATDGRGADCAFEAVGAPETWRQAVALVRKGGRICLFGGCAQGTEVPLDAHRIHYGQLTLFGVFHHTPKYFREALRLISERKVEPRRFVASRIGLDEVPAYFDKMHEKPGLKAAVIP